MKKRVYYRIEMMLESPLSIGNGVNSETDHDVIRGKDGRPYIPASSIAGVFRHTLDSDPTLQKNIFGCIKGENSENSKVIFYDGLVSSEEHSSVRDSVKLEKKVGVDGAKFDMEIIETGAKFVTFLEIVDQAQKIEESVEKILGKLKTGVLRFGAKTSRGYGKVSISSLKKMVFNLETQVELNRWLDFNVFAENDWQAVDEHEVDENYGGYIRIELYMKQNGAISIREYSTAVEKNGESLPDYKHISLNNGKSVIPGTSWAGAFRERFEEFAGKAETDRLFGFIDEKSKETEKSRIIFSESVIAGNCIKEITRNSIDRFSATTKNTALYTESTSYNGTTILEILLKNDTTDKEKALLSAVILDIHNGFLSVGGLTSVGRGMFRIEKVMVNGKDNTSSLKQNDLAELLEVES